MSRSETVLSFSAGNHGPLLSRVGVPAKRLCTLPVQARALERTLQYAGVNKRWQHAHRKTALSLRLRESSPGSPDSPSSPETYRDAVGYQLEFSEEFAVVDGVALLEVATDAHPPFPGIPDSVTPLELVTIVRAYIAFSKRRSGAGLSIYEQATRYPEHAVVLRVRIPEGRSASAMQFQRTPRVEIVSEDEGNTVVLKATLHLTTGGS